MYNILPDIAKACITSSHLSIGALYLLLRILIGPITAKFIINQYDPNFFNTIDNITNEEEQFLFQQHIQDELFQALFNHSDMSEEAKFLIIDQILYHNGDVLFYTNKYTPHIKIIEEKEDTPAV